MRRPSRIEGGDDNDDIDDISSTDFCCSSFRKTCGGSGAFTP